MRITRRQLRRLINEAINEHRIKPALPGHISADHVSKIHSLIDGGSYDQARSIIDALGGSPDYVDNYIEYGEVGDLEKLGNKAADLHATIPKDAHGFAKMADMAPVYDIDAEAYELAKSKALRDHPMDPELGLPSDQTILPDQYEAETDQLRRYYGNRNRNPEGEEYFSGVDFSDLNEHMLLDLLEGGILLNEEDQLVGDIRSLILKVEDGPTAEALDNLLKLLIKQGKSGGHGGHRSASKKSGRVKAHDMR